MFSQACVKNSVHMGHALGQAAPLPSARWDTPPGQTPTGQTSPPHGHCSGRYASYWNAFLYQINNLRILDVVSHVLETCFHPVNKLSDRSCCSVHFLICALIKFELTVFHLEQARKHFWGD